MYMNPINLSFEPYRICKLRLLRLCAVYLLYATMHSYLSEGYYTFARSFITHFCFPSVCSILIRWIVL